jgi:hypothetical protein
VSFKTTVREEWRGKQVKIRGDKVTGKSLFEVGLVVEGQAKLLCAVKTGRLAGSITTQMSDQGSAPRGVGARAGDLIGRPLSGSVALVGTPVEYGPYVEFGTNRSRAQPFLRPALDLARGKVLTIQEHNGRLEFGDYLRRSA